MLLLCKPKIWHFLAISYQTDSLLSIVRKHILSLDDFSCQRIPAREGAVKSLATFFKKRTRQLNVRAGKFGRGLLTGAYKVTVSKDNKIITTRMLSWDKNP